MEISNNLQGVQRSGGISADEPGGSQGNSSELLMVMARALQLLIQAFAASGMGKSTNGGADEASADAPSEAKAPGAKLEQFDTKDFLAHMQAMLEKLQTVGASEGSSASGDSNGGSSHGGGESGGRGGKAGGHGRGHGTEAAGSDAATGPSKRYSLRGAEGDDDGAAKPAPARGADGGSAGRIDGSGFTGDVQQTPGGKQSSIEGTKPGQLRHQTGLSGYEEKNGVESFSAAPGGELSGSSSSARSEAYFKGDTTGKSFAADYKVSEDADATIMQQFNSKEGPSLRVSVNDGNELVVNTGDGSPIHLANIEPGQDFRLEVQDLGNGTTSFNVLDADGKSLGSAEADNTRYGGGNDQFRYGCYLQGDNAGQVLVSDVQTDL